MQCDEDCRTAGFGKTERPVGWEGDGELSRVKLVRHCERGKPAGTDRLHLQALSHSFTLDFVVMASSLSDEAGAQLIEFVEEKLETWLGLKINREKTRVVNLNEPGTSLNFLGFSFRYDQDLRGRDHKYLNIFPSKKAVKREVAKIHELTDLRRSFQPIVVVVGEINKQTAGWSRYFSFGYPRMAFRRINYAIQQRLKHHLNRRSQRRFTKPEGESYYAYFRRLGVEFL
jgi:RNA-directed DNA polymerase